MQNVEKSVESQEQHDMRGDILDVVEFGHHVQLRQDRQRLQPYRKCPEYTVNREFTVEKYAEEDSDYV